MNRVKRISGEFAEAQPPSLIRTQRSAEPETPESERVESYPPATDTGLDPEFEKNIVNFLGNEVREDPKPCRWSYGIGGGIGEEVPIKEKPLS